MSTHLVHELGVHQYDKTHYICVFKVREKYYVTNKNSDEGHVATASNCHYYLQNEKIQVNINEVIGP